MPATYDFDLVCIGSGPAGQRAAIQAAKLGKRVAIVEKRQTPGGICLEPGTIPSKTFREAVLSFFPQHGQVGFMRSVSHGSNRPSAVQLLERVVGVVKREAQVVEDQLWRNDIGLIRGEASFKDSHALVVESEDGTRTVTAEYVLIAVGTIPAPPPGVPVDHELVITSDEITHLRHLPRRLAVVGAGIIGLEYASMFAVLEIDVTVLDKREQVLEFLDREIVDELIHQMRTHDVTFRLGEAVEHLELANGPLRQVIMQLESGKRVVSDMVLFAAGRVGATGRLNLAAAGLAADQRGRLKADGQFRTAVSHIFAAGDVIGYPSLAATSAEQGRLAACYAFGADAEPMAEHFPIGIYTIPEVSMVGAPEHELTEKKIPYETGVARYKEIARGQILGDDSGLLKDPCAPR